MRLEAAVGGVVFIANVLCSAAFGHEIAHGLKLRHAGMHLQMKRQAEATKTMQIVKRNDVFGAQGGVWPTVNIPAGFTLAGGVEVTAIPNADIIVGTASLSSAMAIATNAGDPAEWNTQADQACTDAANKLNGKASNPSGMVACYNVPFLDATKGTFEAELRIFNISMPSAEFIGVPENQMMVTFKFRAASLQASDGTLPVKRSLAERQMASMTTTAASSPSSAITAKEVTVRKYIGMLNPGTFNPNMNQTDFKALLTPEIAISGTNPTTNQNVQAQLSPIEASFVAGLFTTTTGSLTDPRYLLDKPAEKLAAAAQGLPTPFIVPGLAINVFPIGLIITSIWLLLFSLAVGLGTLGRIQFREQYRRELKQQMSSGFKRI